MLENVVGQSRWVTPQSWEVRVFDCLKITHGGRICVLCATLTAFNPLISIAQESPVPARQLSKADKIEMAIDMLANIKSAVGENRKGTESATYRSVSVRLFQCAALYGVLSKAPTSNPSSRGWFDNASDIYGMVSSFLYPDGMDNFKREMSSAHREVLEMRKSNDEKLGFYFLRNCRDFSEPQVRTVGNAIVELSLR